MTRIVDPLEVAVKHFGDSVALLSLTTLFPGAKVIDVGAGADQIEGGLAGGGGGDGAAEGFDDGRQQRAHHRGDRGGLAFDGQDVLDSGGGLVAKLLNFAAQLVLLAD